MQHKNIKLIIRKQLKKRCPDWKRLRKKDKRAIVKMVLGEAVSGIDFSQQRSGVHHTYRYIQSRVGLKTIGYRMNYLTCRSRAAISRRKQRHVGLFLFVFLTGGKWRTTLFAVERDTRILLCHISGV